MRKFFISIVCFLGFLQFAEAQTPYNYTMEGFDDAVFPTGSGPALETAYTSPTGTWRLFKSYSVNSTDPCPVNGTNRALRMGSGLAAYVVSPTLSQGVAQITFNDGRTNRTFTYYTSTDDGLNWSAGTTVASGATSCGTITITLNSGVINKIKIANMQAQDAGLDNLLITSFTTNPPTVTTTAVTAITPSTASSGGNVTADGGAPVTARGVCWSTAANPTIADPKTVDGTGLGSFPSALTGLTPSTLYHVRAYATNAVGTAYGNDISFTTAVATPTLTAVPNSLNFGTIFQGTISPQQTFTLSGIYLNPGPGNITITAPAGYQVSLTSGTGFGNSVSVPYAGTTLAPTLIYVVFYPPTNGAYNGNVVNAGGGAPAVNVAVTGVGSSLPVSGNLTNLGLDFWTGYGYHSRMKDNDNTNGAWMSLYISSKNAAVVKISLPGIADPSFPRTINIPANTSVEVTNFPQGDFNNNNNNPTNLPDARLYFTGITPRGIHIESLNGEPIAVFEHTYGKDAAGAMMVFPTNTWGATYNVLSLGGKSNSGIPNSFFFVMAKEDGTQIQITPAADIIDSSNATLFKDNTPLANIKYPANVPFNITLNKGQIFNAMSRIIGSGSSGVGQDLTGSLIKSIDCNKKIAVFAGNGRTFVNTSGCSVSSGSDNMLQQMFPRVAWGTKYLTTPTKTMEYAVYKICVQDPTTNVWVNNPSHTTPLTGIINNFYYQIENNNFNLIEADKPIMVIQYIITGGCKTTVDGNNGQGDPEMIILSPVQQAINNSSIFSASKLNIIANGGASYINVVIKTAGVASFKLDPATNPTNVCDTGTTSYSAGGVYGSSATIPVANAFRVHPNEPGYSYARFKVASGQYHNIQSDSGFNAIAYGLAQGESYGYSAGTAIKDLSAIIATHNPYDSVSGSKTCKGNPSTMEIALPYPAAQISQIVWDAGISPNVSPNGIFTDNAPVPFRTYTSNDITYNVYKMPVALTFNATGIYRITATVSGTFSSECGSTQVIPIDMEVVSDSAKFNFVQSSCGSTSVSFTDQSSTHLGGSIKQWLWDFGDPPSGANNTSALQNPVHNYSSISVFTAKLRIVNEIGCYSDTSRIIDLTGGLRAKFGVSPNDTVCTGSTLVFSDSSTSTGSNGAISIWHWNFGEGPLVNAPNGNNQTHTYNTPGVYWVKLYVETAAGCMSPVDSMKIVINATPTALFNIGGISTGPVEVCLNNTVTFTDQSSVSPGLITNWYWDYGDGNTDAFTSPTNPTHTYTSTGTFTVTLYVTANGCISPTRSIDVHVNALPVASFTYSTPACAGQTVTFNSGGSTSSNGIINGWDWDFGDGNTSTLQNPTHTFTSGGIYTVKLRVKSQYGCFSSYFITNITVRSTPLADFILPGNLCLPNASASFTNTTTINDGTLPLVTYVWDFGDGSPTVTTTNPSHIYTGVGPWTVTLTATSSFGCSHSISKQLTSIYAQPIAGFTTTPTPEACVNSVVTFTDNSTAPGSSINQWSWDYGDGNTAVFNTATNPTHTYTGTGTFTVKLIVRSATGCQSAIFQKDITINPLPTASFTVQPIRCAGNSILFTDASSANAGTLTNHDWNFGDGSPIDHSVNPTHIYTNPGTYNVTLTVTNSKTCVSALFTLQVVINPKPVANFTVPNICLPTGTGTFTESSTISSGSVTGWTWNFGDATALGNGSPVSHTYAAGGQYQVTLTATSAAGCSKDTIKTVTVYNNPTAGYTIASTGSICSNLPITITNTTVVTGFGSVNKIEVYWDYLNNLTDKTVDNTPVTGGTYTHQYAVFGSPATKTYRVMIIAYSGSGCTDQYFKDIVVNAAPVAQLAAIPPVCQELTPFILTQGTESAGLPGIGVYSGPGITLSPLFSPAQAGQGIHTIRYTYTGTNGCSSFDEKTIEVYPTPIINAGPDLKVLEGDAVTLQPTQASNNLTYLWLPSTYLDDATKANPVCKPTNDITYTLTVRSADGCTASDDLFIKVIRDFIVPNTFTPNNDGINDLWLIDNLDLYPNHRVQVFNRYGQLMFETKNYSKPWDGTYKGKPLPVGTYYYIIELGGQRKPKTGYVTIIK